MSIELDAVTVTLGSSAVVDRVSLVVADGERVAIMGPSGAGKSTLLRTIAGLVAPDAGVVRLDGIDRTSAPPHERRVGLMFQDYALFPHLDVSANVAYGLRMAGMAPADRRSRAAKMLDLVGLSAYGERRIEELSGGEQQRVALARTLAPEPDAILFDEPLGSLDQALRDELLTEMRAIVDELGIPAVYVTHDRSEAEAFADRMAIMHEGRLLRIDTPEHLWRDPHTEFVARALGHRTIIDGASIGHAGRVVILDSAVTVDPALPPNATVTSSEFRDGRYRTQVDVGGDSILLWTEAPTEAGARLGIRIDPSGVVPLVDEVGRAHDPTEPVVDRE